MSEEEYWNRMARCAGYDCNYCPAGRNLCSAVTIEECAEVLRRAHAKTQPPFLELLAKTGCPPATYSCVPFIQCQIEDKRQCWLNYLKMQYLWQPVGSAEVPTKGNGEE